MKTSRIRPIVIALLFAASALAAQTSREEFRQMVAQLAQNPGNDDLREKIIQAAASLDPAPAIPEEARRNYIEGMTLHQEAKNPEDEKIALASFSKALAIAPWWGDVYLGQSVSQELTGGLDDGLKSLRFYLLSNPGEEKARAAQDHVYVLEAKKKKALAAFQASQQQIEQLKNLTGWWACQTGCSGYHWVRSDGSEFKATINNWTFEGHFEQDAITGLAALPSSSEGPCTLPEQKHRMTGFLEKNATVLRLKYELTTFQGKSHSQPGAILGYLSATDVCDSVTPVSTSPQELTLVGGAKTSYFGARMTTITSSTADQVSDRRLKEAMKEGLDLCRRWRRLEAGGVLIISVDPSSSAAGGGLKPGDVINLQGRPGRSIFCNEGELSDYLKGVAPRSRFDLRVFDGSKSHTYEFTMGLQRESAPVIQASDPPPRNERKQK